MKKRNGMEWEWDKAFCDESRHLDNTDKCLVPLWVYDFLTFVVFKAREAQRLTG